MYWSAVFASALCISTFLSLPAFSAGVSYRGSSVIRCTPTTAEQLDFLHEMSEDPDSDLDFWSEPRRIGGFVDVLVKNVGQKSLFEESMKKMLISCSEMIVDVQALINAQNLLHGSTSSKTNSSFYDVYHTSDEVLAYLDSLVRRNEFIIYTSKWDFLLF